MLEEVTGWRVVERMEPRTGEESHESEGEGEGRKAIRKELRRGGRRLRGADGTGIWELHLSSDPGEEGGA